VLESKDELKSRGLPSPDLGDALALTFSYPVVKERDLRRQAAVLAGHHPRQFDRQTDVTAYDPLAGF
jgi:hypothetical protein